MNYFGQFRNLTNTLYQIDFQLDTGSGTTELVLSRDSFIVEYNSGNNIYEPLKLSNSTCSIITTDIVEDLFTSNIQGVKVSLINKTANPEVVEYVGFVTPNIYSQGYDRYYDDLQIECVDGLSTLEYFEFFPLNTGLTSYVSFISLIMRALSKCNCYKNLYVNNNLSISTITGYNNLIERLYINEGNFVNDEKNNTYKEILYDLMKYLNHTMTAYGEDVYIIDYNYILTNTGYTKYTTTDNWATYTTTANVNVSHNHTITTDSFMRSGSKLSLTDTYNRASILIRSDIIDTILPEVYDDDLLENFTDENGKHYFSRTYSGTTTIMRWLKNTDITTYYYYYNAGTYTPTTITGYNSDILKSSHYFGGTLTQVANITDQNSSTINFENYLTMKRWYSSMDEQIEHPMFEFNGDGDIALLYDDYYFIINFNTLFDTTFTSYYPKESDLAPSGGEIEVSDSADGMYIPAKLQIGNKYWNGTIWTTIDSTFKIKIEQNGSKKLFNKWYSVENQVNYIDEIGSEGTKIPITIADNLIGTPTFTLYNPAYTTTTYSVFIGTIWIKNFEANLVKKADILNYVKKDTDTLYQNVINDDFSIDFDSIELNVFSDTGKGLCYSSVLFKTDLNKYEFVKEISSKTNTTKLQEYNIIENLVELYDAPNKQIDLTLKNIFKPYSVLYYNGDKNVIDKYTIDYFNSYSELSIITIK